MSSPQLEKGFVRIANELWDEVLRRDFSKRQQNLVLFIWRLSYGTGQKDCMIDKFSSFEIAGLYRSDIKKELTYLRNCSVLEWDEKSMVFSINKNYKFWQISPNKNWDLDRFDALIHHNLSRKKVSKTPTQRKKAVSKTLTYASGKVSKSLISKLVKHELRQGSKSVQARVRSVPKDSIKDIKDIKDKKNSRKQVYDVDSPEYILTEFLITKMIENNPNAKVPSDLTKWVDAMEKIHRLDNYAHQQIKDCIEWCQSDDFWKSNILSAGKLREKMPTLILQSQRRRKPNVTNRLQELYKKAVEDEERETVGGY